mgnify:CR=1 FL=1
MADIRRALSGHPPRDSRTEEVVVKAALADHLNIQPSEVDNMESWMVNGLMEYIAAKSRKR